MTTKQYDITEIGVSKLKNIRFEKSSETITTDDKFTIQFIEFGKIGYDLSMYPGV